MSVCAKIEFEILLFEIQRVRSPCQEAYEMNASVEYFSASILDHERNRMLHSLGKPGLFCVA